MGKPTGFLDYARMDCPARSAGARVADFWIIRVLTVRSATQRCAQATMRRLSCRCLNGTAAGSPAAAWTAAYRFARRVCRLREYCSAARCIT